MLARIGRYFEWELKEAALVTGRFFVADADGQELVIKCADNLIARVFVAPFDLRYLLFGFKIGDLIDDRHAVSGTDLAAVFFIVVKVFRVQESVFKMCIRDREKRDHLKLAEESLTNLFGSRRINAMVAPFIVGLLPAVSAVLMARPIVDQAAADDLNAEERCFVTSFYRHISESFLPTYPSIILAIELSGVPLPRFVLAMLPLVLLLFILGFIFYIRKIPKTAGFKATNRRKSWQNLIISLWGIVSAIILILAFQWPVYLALAPILVLSIFVNRFSWKELRPMFISCLLYTSRCV